MMTLFYLTSSILIWLIRPHMTKAEEVCHDDFFRKQCPVGDVIIIERADYGRMYARNCISEDFGHIGLTCRFSVKRHVERLCGGRWECQFKVTDAQFPDYVPCHKELKAFLDVYASCITVIQPENTCITNEPTTVTETQGFLSSLVSHRTNCGTIQSPWVLKSSPGQRFNITLLDYFVSNITQPSHSPACRVYATIKDKSANGPVTVCGGKQSENNAFPVLLSTSNEIEVRFIPTPANDDNLPYFLLHFKAIGCPDPTPNPAKVMERLDSDTVKLTCQSTGHVAKLTCEEEVWVGHITDCEYATQMERSTNSEGSSISNALAIAIIGAIAVGVSAAILCIGVVCLKRTPSHHPEQHFIVSHSPMKLVTVQSYPDEKPCSKVLVAPDEIELNTVRRGQERMRHMHALTAELRPEKTPEGTIDRNSIQYRDRLIAHHIYESPEEILNNRIIGNTTQVRYD